MKGINTQMLKDQSILKTNSDGSVFLDSKDGIHGYLILSIFLWEKRLIFRISNFSPTLSCPAPGSSLISVYSFHKLALGMIDSLGFEDGIVLLPKQDCAL